MAFTFWGEDEDEDERGGGCMHCIARRFKWVLYFWVWAEKNDRGIESMRMYSTVFVERSVADELVSIM